MVTYAHTQTRAYVHTQKHADTHTCTQRDRVQLCNSCAVINSEQSVYSLGSVAQDVGGVLSDFCHCMVKSLGHLDYKL